ncbi:hypothetical protein [Vibrio owensii]|uniref:hypothetical protein n=1 Tax=Vibrio owensii TaxID=696485 RepID=UPI0038CF00A2
MATNQQKNQGGSKGSSLRANARGAWRMAVITLKKYCELEGVTPDAIKKRIREGIWKIGREVLRIKGWRTLMIDTDAVDAFFRDPKNHAR